MTSISGVCTSVGVVVVADAQEAVDRGYDYKAPGKNVKPITLKELVVVRSGTMANKPTVDFILEDETGQQFVFMITGAILKALPLAD